MADRFQVVTSTLFDTFMRSNGGVPSGSCQVFPIFVRDVFTFAVAEALGETKIDDVNGVLRVFFSTDKEIIRFNVPMNNSFFVNLLN